MQWRPLLAAPLVGIAVCLLVLSIPQVVEVGYPVSWSFALGEILIAGLFMFPAACLAEFLLFLPIHRYLVRRQIQHRGVYAIVGLLVGSLAGPVGFLFTVAVVLGILQGRFELPTANTVALIGTTLAGACAGTAAALVFRTMSARALQGSPDSHRPVSKHI